jgi:hypothetical protein
MGAKFPVYGNIPIARFKEDTQKILINDKNCKKRRKKSRITDSWYKHCVALSKPEVYAVIRPTFLLWWGKLVINSESIAPSKPNNGVDAPAET